jgi:hypothetical protein
MKHPGQGTQKTGSKEWGGPDKRLVKTAFHLRQTPTGGNQNSVF